MATRKKEDIMKPVLTIDESTITTLKNTVNEEEELKKTIAEATNKLKTIRAARKQIQEHARTALRAITPTRVRRTAAQIAADNAAAAVLGSKS